MKKTSIEIVETDKNMYKIKFPFLRVPVEMDKNFFQKRMKKQAYQIAKRSEKHIEK